MFLPPKAFAVDKTMYFLPSNLETSNTIYLEFNFNI